MGLAFIPLSDRVRFFSSFRTYLEQAESNASPIGLLVLDIVDFKRINHVFSYAFGDGLLFQLSQRLGEVVGADDCIHRIGSDEFALIFPGLDASALSLQAAAIVQKLREPFEWEEQPLSIDVVMGGVSHDGGREVNLSSQEDRVSADLLLIDAERLLHQAKAEGRSICLADPSGVGEGDDYWRLERDSLTALKNNELELYFQPKLKLSTGTPIRAEALLRWSHPERGLIGPEMLTSVLRRLNREFALTKWVLHTALRHMKEWPSGFFSSSSSSSPSMGVAINVPAGIVHHPDLRYLVKDALAIWQVSPEQLTLEITESAIIEDKQAGFSNLAFLKDLGVHISIDDFGTGYSSMEYFKTIPATELKIDMTFVSNMLSNKADYHLVELSIELAKRFGLSVVAEGVEDEATLLALKKLQCDYAQGYYISKPLPAEAYQHWLRNFSLGR